MASLIFICDLGNNQNDPSVVGKCQDTHSELCWYYTRLCQNTSPQNLWVQQSCPKTCGKCWYVRVSYIMYTDINGPIALYTKFLKILK